MAKLFRLFFFYLAVVCFHHGLHVGHILLADGRLVVVILEEHGEHVGYGLAFGVAHGIHGGVGALGDELMLQRVTATVAAYDAANFPEADVVEEFTARDSNLAHEQLIDVVGGG